MADTVSISKATVERLPLYLRCLKELKEKDIDIVSSEELGAKLGITPVQIRKDLACFGEFGKRGVGYDVSALLNHVNMIIGLHYKWEVALVGAGHLGTALANYQGFETYGFRITAIFDNDPAKIGLNLNGVTVMPVEQIRQVIPEKNIKIAMIAVPAKAGQQVADELVAAGIKGVLNFSLARIVVPDDVYLYNADLLRGLTSLSFYLSNTADRPE